ncbi:putative thioredoxin [Xylaria arbuscula]|nr:putative thioredoxin [Xylaria arbuscula]
MTNFAINIVSDPVCPWCYIGRKRLGRAISLFKKVYPNARHDTFSITWEAYYLDATAPSQGVSFSQRQLQKIAVTNPGASPEEVRELAARQKGRLVSVGREEGLAFSFRGKIGNTRSAHRAIAYSRTCPRGRSSNSVEGVIERGGEEEEGGDNAQDRFVTALFAAYFEGEADITSHADLADIAGTVGLDRDEMLAWLDGGKGGEEVDEQDRVAREMGLKGVPHFAVQGRRVAGARDIQDFMELFVKVKEDEQEQEQAINADIKGTVGSGIAA